MTHRRVTMTIAIVAAGVVLAGAARAARADKPSSPGELSDWSKAFFPAQFIIKHQRAIKLTRAQQQKLTAEVKAATAEFVDLQVKLQNAYEDAVDLANKAGAKEAELTASVDAALRLEAEIKRRNAVMLIRIRGMLNAAQISTLHSLRDKK